MKTRIKFKNASEFVLLLAKRGLNIADFADKIDISFSYVYKIIKEENFVTPKMAAKIAEGLDVPLEHIFYVSID